jgi:hypothetical protein
MTALASDAARSPIVEATFEALVEHGYAGTSTREIAKRAKVSKRELQSSAASRVDPPPSGIPQTRHRQIPPLPRTLT